MVISQFPLTEGGPPPQFGVPEGLNTEDMLLYTAWIHGLTPGSVAHRLALFSFLQTHIANKSDESLQTVIEKSPYWTGKGKGYYELKALAAREMARKFGEVRQSVNLGIEFTFSKQYKGREFMIVVDVTSRKLIPYINGKVVTGVQANDILEDLGVSLPKSGTSQPRKVLNWIIQDNNYRWVAKYPKALQEPSKFSPIALNSQDAEEPISIFREEDDELSFPEGRETYRLHRTKERNRVVVELAKRRASKQDGFLRCEVCGFSFFETYGEIGEGFIEAHHNKPLSELREQVETRIEDIALVCSNCHRILHRRRPWLTIADLKATLKRV